MTGIFYLLQRNACRSKSQHRTLTVEEENSLAATARARTRNLSITSSTTELPPLLDEEQWVSLCKRRLSSSELWQRPGPESDIVQSVSQPASQSASQPISQLVSQSVSLYFLNFFDDVNLISLSHGVAMIKLRAESVSFSD